MGQGAAGRRVDVGGIVADVVARLADPAADVLDAACGTGLVGAALARQGFTSVDGLDVSPRMITVGDARRAEIERHLQQLSRRGVVRVTETVEVPLHPSTRECHTLAVLEVVEAAQPSGPRW